MVSITEYSPEYQQEKFGISITAEDQPDLKSVYEFHQQYGGNFWIALVDGVVAGTIALKI